MSTPPELDNKQAKQSVEPRFPRASPTEKW